MLIRRLLAAALLAALPFSAQAQLAYSPVANDNTTGTVVGKLAKFTSAGAAITLLTSDTTWTGLVVGETVSTASPALTGNAILAIHGPANCIFDGTTVIGHYVTISGTVAGDCKDTGAATYPTSGAVVGIALSVNSGAGTSASIYLIPPGGIAPTGVTAGAYTSSNITVGADGRLTAAANGSGGGVAPSTAYIPTFWYTPYNLGSGSAFGNLTTYCSPITFYQTATIGHFGAVVGTTVAATNFQIAVYADSATVQVGPVGPALEHTGNITSATGGSQSGAVTSPVSLAAGTYWLCIMDSDTTATATIDLAATSAMGTLARNTIMPQSGISGTTATALFGTYTTFGTWPTFTTSSTWTTTTSPYAIWYQISSVP